MDAIQKQKIGLCIGGTKLRQSGFTPLVISGILACEVKKMDRVSLVQEKPAYIITHTNEYILYQLIDSYVKPYDRDTLGLLSIALTIKKDVQLADGKSPYSLLKEAYDKFRSEYMTLDKDGYDNFLNKTVNSADFEVILEKYSLEERLSEYIPMSSDLDSRSVKLCVPQEKLEELFRDSQYPEFAKFKEIEIGVDSSKTLSSRGLENIEIPRPQIYALEVNGERKEQKFVRRNDTFDSTKFLHNTEDIKYERMSFNLGELLDAPTHRLESGNSSAILDKERNLIVCTIDEKRFIYLLEYEILGGTEEERENMADWILHRKIKLTFGEKSPEFFPSTPKQASIPASWAHQAVSYKTEQMVTFGFGVTSRVDDENKHVMVTITIHTPKRDTYSGTSSGYQGRRHNPNVPAPIQTNSGERTENDHVEDVGKLPSPNEEPSNKQPSNNKAIKRWILLGVCCLVSMCIGIFIERQTELFAKDLTRNDSVQIASQAIKTIPFNSIFDFNTIDIDSIENLAPLVNEIKSRYWKELKKEVTAPVDATQNVIQEEVNTQEDKAQKTEKLIKRKEILGLVNERNWEKCKDKLLTYKSLQYITSKEANAITAVLWVHKDNEQYEQIRPTALKELRDTISNTQFNSLEEVVSFNRKTIIPFVSDKENK